MRSLILALLAAAAPALPAAAQPAPPAAAPSPGEMTVGQQPRGDRGSWQGGGGPGRSDWRREGRADWRADRQEDRARWRQERREWRRDRDARRDDERRWDDGRGGGPGWEQGSERGWDGDRGGWAGWDRGWRRDRRYDWQDWRFRHGDRYRLGRYRPPPGWAFGYRRFQPGIVLSPPLFGRAYWLLDPWAFRLPPVGPGLRWIRYWDDVVLVDLRSGRVLDVVPGFFW